MDVHTLNMLQEKGEGLQYAAIVSALIVVVFFALGPGKVLFFLTTNKSKRIGLISK